LKCVVIAPGKLILLGEYAVLEGAHALVTAINRFARVEVESSERRFHQLKVENLNIPTIDFHLDSSGKVSFDRHITSDLEDTLKFFTETCEFVNSFVLSCDRSIMPCTINLDTSQFYNSVNNTKLGLGSSAALTVALFIALTEYSGCPVTMPQLFSNAMQIHHRAQGQMGSGIDIAASVYGGILDYSIDLIEAEEPKHINVFKDIHIVPVWSGKPSSTRYFLSQLNSFRENNRISYQTIMGKLIYLAGSGCEAYKRQNQNNFLQIVHDYYKTLENLGKASGAGIISPDHAAIAKIVRTAGGVYKPSGAGGGDLGVAFCPSRQIAKNVSSAIENSKYDIIDLQIVPKGVALC
jgi:phosphomevalonate kinase